MSILEINRRYSTLANEDCCLSCGGAINYSMARLGETCVDLGCGKGIDVMKLSNEVGNKGFVYGIDIADGMIGKAASLADKLHVRNVKFIKADLENIPLDDKSVDLIISNCTINHASDKQKVWNEISRILKADGRFVVSDIYSLSQVPEAFRSNPDAIAECWGGAVTRDEYLNHLSNAGFHYVEILEESKPYKKGEIEVCSFTIKGKFRHCCCS